MQQRMHLADEEGAIEAPDDTVAAVRLCEAARQKGERRREKLAVRR